MTREVEGVVPVTEWTAPFLPAVGFGRAVKLIFEREVRVTGLAIHGERRLGRCHFGGTVFSGVETAWLDGSSPIHTWVHLSQR
jgi:hypothetical protein